MASACGEWLPVVKGRSDWRWLIAAIAFVWVAEAMNTAIEHVCNAVSPQYQTEVEKAKDVAAGAVLLAAGGAALIGVSVFAPCLGLRL